MSTADEKLAAAAVAWQTLGLAEDKVTRLRRYDRLNDGMKRDLRAAEERAREARRMLDEVLGVGR